ncbi:MAG: leucine-rich repeat domain-containing protein, partial [Eubacteriales bacterium]
NCLIDTENKKLILGCQNSVIPTDGSVTEIGFGAFADCAGLTSITIPDSVTSIGDSAFSNCSGLASITIPGSVTVIGDFAFHGCSSLTGITVSEGNTTYHSSGNCLIDTENKKLILGCQNSIIPTDGSVTSIGDSAFYGCSGLTSITIPDSVSEIGYAAFEDCTGLTSITISNSITVIGGSAFYNCSGLTSITIPDSVTSISFSSFYGCSGLTSVTIPDSVTQIGYGAFDGCTNLDSITVYNPICSISNYSIPSATTIYGFAGSTAEDYANVNGNPFVALPGFDRAEITEEEAGNGTTYNTISVAEGDLSAYSSNRTHEDGSFDLRIILAENDAVRAGDKVTLNFYKDGNATPYTITRTVDTDYVEGKTMKIYTSLIAAGETYVAGESCTLFGFVVTDIPADGFDTATLTVTSADGSVIAATQFDYDAVAPQQ